MKTIKEFFNNLDSNIKKSTNKKTLKILERRGKSYVYNIPTHSSSKIKKYAKARLKKSMQLIKKIARKFK